MYQQILKFWFEEIDPSKWWAKDVELDRTITQKFSAVHAAAANGELYEWRLSPQGRLAEIILLDQFSRNMFRNSAQAYACDLAALVLAQEAVALGTDAVLTNPQATFLYLPFMHSESLKIHEQAMVLFQRPGLEYSFDFELKHKAIIEQFGRYPHRNDALGRTSTEREIDFLKQPGSAF